MSRSHARAITAALMGFILLAGCGSASSGSSTSASGSSATNASCAQGAGSQPGITDTSITLGSSMPLSGPVAAIGAPFGASLQAWADSVNAGGGIKMADGKTRKVVLKILDDAYDPAKTLQNARQLVQQDHVFALMGVVGTPTTQAMLPFTNSQQVPVVFIGSPSALWGPGYTSTHLSIGWQPADTTEAAIYASWLAKNHPGATVAVLEENDAYGQEFVGAFNKAIEGTSIKVIATQKYSPTTATVSPEVINLASSKADVFLDATAGSFGTQAIKTLSQQNWHPLHIIFSGTSSPAAILAPAGLQNAQGIISAEYHMDPSDPRFANTPAMKAYLALMAKYAPKQDAKDTTDAYGIAMGQSMAYVLEHSLPYRKCVMQTVGSLNHVKIPLLLPGITLTTSAKDGYPMETMQLIQFKGTRYVPIGKPVSYEGKTPTN